MPVRLQLNERNGIFFITFTCQGWLPLFDTANAYDVVYKWFDYLKSKGHFINGLVIMPNHLHAIIALKSSKQSINTIVSNAKRFMAYEIVKRLQQSGQTELLEKLSKAVTLSDSKRGKLHQVFEPSFDCKECYNEAFLLQKLEYMHQNPCRGIWNLAARPVEYKHSSAKFYYTGEFGVYEIVSYKRMMDVDLSS